VLSVACLPPARRSGKYTPFHESEDGFGRREKYTGEGSAEGLAAARQGRGRESVHGERLQAPLSREGVLLLSLQEVAAGRATAFPIPRLLQTRVPYESHPPRALRKTLQRDVQIRALGRALREVGGAPGAGAR